MVEFTQQEIYLQASGSNTPGDLPTRFLGTLNFLNARYTPPTTLQLVACAHCPGQQGQLAIDGEFKKIGQGLPARKQSEM